MFTKVVNPCKCEINGRKFNAFAKIEYSDDGRLSICGVVGPKSNGDAAGSCGQCIDSIRSGEATAEWSAETLSRFCDIWDEYHLNDMRPYCLHQKDAGFADLAKKNVKVFHYLMTRDAYDLGIRSVDNMSKFKVGDTVIATEEANERYAITRCGWI